MLLRRFHLPQLGHASHLVGDVDAGIAIVVDPQLDPRPYVDAAAHAGVRIAYVLDTHAHSDYASGRDALAELTGATVLASAHGTLQPGQRPLAGGDVLRLGATWLRSLHLPGHAPEQVGLVVGTDPAASEPRAVLTGGSLLCGDIGRPDIDTSVERLENARRAIGAIREQLLPLGDHVRVCPTHVAGSLCSASADGAVETTIGRERESNPWLQPGADLPALLSPLPRKPGFWARLRASNTIGGDPARMVPKLARIDATEAAAEALLLLDARDAEAFAQAHLRGSVHLGSGALAPVLAGALLDPLAGTAVVADSHDDALRLAHDLQRVGIAPPFGWVQVDPAAWRAASIAVDEVDVLSAAAAAAGGARRLLDVRQPGEWALSHPAGALLLSLPDLPELAGTLPAEPLVVACAAGRRSITAVSVLRALGREGDVSLAGGVRAWQPPALAGASS